MLEISLFYIAATVALVATILAMTRANAIHALIYLLSMPVPLWCCLSL